MPHLLRWTLLPPLRPTAFTICLCYLFASSAIVRAEAPLLAQTEQLFPLPLDGTISLENSDGSIHIYGWYEPRVRLVALRKAYTQSRLRQIRVQARAGPATLNVQTVIPEADSLFTDRSGTVDYSLNVPEPANLKLKLANGEITLQGLRGAKVDLELINGRIIALNCYAQVRARAKNGVLEAFFEWWESLPANFDYFLQHGRIGVRLPAEARFRVDAETDDGRIHQGFRFPKARDAGAGQVLKASTRPAPTLSLNLRTDSGNIGLEVIR